MSSLDIEETEYCVMETTSLSGPVSANTHHSKWGRALPVLLGSPLASLQPAPDFSPQSMCFLLLPFSSPRKPTEGAACLHSPFTLLHSSVHHGLLITLQNLPCDLSPLPCSPPASTATSSSPVLRSHLLQSLPLCSHNTLHTDMLYSQ